MSSQTSLAFLEHLINIDSPTGFTDRAVTFISQSLTSLSIESRISRKGSLSCRLGKEPLIALAAHVDTLGGIVSAITSTGTLRISPLGGLLFPSFEGCYCRIHTQNGSTYTGTLLLDNPSAHTNGNAASTPRTAETMHIRVDELNLSHRRCTELGIAIGDIVAFEPGYQECQSGFIKSRFLDNKAGCFILYEVARYFQGREAPVELLFSTYEEVGHGGAFAFSPTVRDLIVVDMGVVGGNTAGREEAVSICAKDSGGPYDYKLRCELASLARSQNIPHEVDIYPHYTSDGTVALRAGIDARVGLVGPGVAASHGMERTHKTGIQATVRLLSSFIERFMKEPVVV